jgi:hypothetical protein
MAGVFSLQKLILTLPVNCHALAMLRLLLFKGVIRKFLVISLISFVSVISVILLDVASYYRLTTLDDLFSLQVKARNDAGYTVELIYSKTAERIEYQIEGDQWQLDYRIIRLTPGAFMAAPGHLFQFTRLTNRYEDDERQMYGARFVYSLRKQAFYRPDLWDFFYRYQQYLPFIDTVYGGSVYMPLADMAVYKLQVGYAGLVVMPANQQAVAAISNWHSL